MKKQMNALVCKAYGNHEVLEIQQRPVPTIDKGEVLVRVHASGITRADTMMRQGTPKFGRIFLGIRRPKRDIIGTGFSGEIVATGEHVQGFKKGDLVFGCTTTQFGANAEYLKINENAQLMHKPDFITHAQACTLSDGALTSFHFIQNVGMAKPGERMMIIGASGSLGLAAIQIARQFGLHVTAVCSAANVDLVRSYGAQEVLAYDRTPLNAHTAQYDIIYDAVGESSFRQSRKQLRKGGRYITSVLKGKVLCAALGNCRRSGKKARFSATGFLKAPMQREMLQKLLGMIERGSLRIHVERMFPLEAAKEAHRYVDSGRKKGNVVFEMPA